MKEEIKKVLNKIEQNGFEAYIVGGFVRDYLLHRESVDVDIATNALPKDIANIFGSSKELGTYGTFNLKTNHFNYDITTYRQESKYENRHPKKITYTSNLLEDLKRRDFTMNALCLTTKEQIIDIFNGVLDLENKIIRMIGNPKIRLREDPLRILRAIRFSCTLNLQLDEELSKAIQENKESILKLSNYRLKQELNKILLSPHFQKGFDLLTSFGILDLLELKPQSMQYVDDVNGMWAQINTKKDFGFTKIEKKQIETIKMILKEKEINSTMIFSYGLYPVLVAAKIKQIPMKEIMKIEKSMPIKKRQDLDMTFDEINQCANTSLKETKHLQNQIIDQVLKKQLPNQKEAIKKYIMKETCK